MEPAGRLGAEDRYREENPMKATVWKSPNNVQVEEVPDPRILNSQDAIVKITSTAICG